MKKLFLILVFSGLFITNSFADNDEASDYCRIEGTANDYVEATAYVEADNGKINGYVIISNSSSKPLMSYRLVVTAERVRTYYHGELTWETGTMFDSTCHVRCEPYSNTRVDLSTLNTFGGYVRGVTVSIGNPTCAK